MRRALFGPFLLCSLLVVGLPTRAQEARWRLHAVEFARSEGVPARRLIRGADPAERVDMSWYFFVARRGARVVLIDVGTDLFTEARGRGQRRSWRVTHAVPVTEALARLDLAPREVTDVVLTHHHWDHVGALGHYEDARVHAHPRAWRRLPAPLRRPVEREDRLEDGPDGERWPGFALRTWGAHTATHRMVRLDCADGPLLIASDAAYLFRNVEAGAPVAVATSAARNRAALAAAAEEVGAAGVLPGHDPALFTRHPGSAPGVASICP